jgi:hypothetical protein
VRKLCHIVKPAQIKLPSTSNHLGSVTRPHSTTQTTVTLDIMALPFGAHVPLTNQNPSPLAFGFGLGIPQHHLPPELSYSAQPQFAAASTASFASEPSLLHRPSPPTRSSTKRRHDADEEADAAMETARSPSPDRPKRALGGKRLRMAPESVQRASPGAPEIKPEEDDSVDVGSLLGKQLSEHEEPCLSSHIPTFDSITSTFIPITYSHFSDFGKARAQASDS